MLSEIILNIEESYPEERDKCVARIDRTHMQRLNLKMGDIVRLEGKCVCYAFVKELERGDKGTDIIRLSKPVRMTIHAGFGDSVMIKKEDMEKICKLEDLE